MFLRRVAHYYNQAGWTVEVSPTLPGGARPFRPDMVVRRNQLRQAVLVREEPPGPFEVAEFGANCKKNGLRGAIVCPDDPRVLDLCENAGLDFIAGEGIGEVPVFGHAPPPPPLALPPEPVVARVEIGPVAVLMARKRHIPWWRWAIVALIWSAALAVTYYDLRQLFGP